MRPAGPQKPLVFAPRPPTLLDHFAADLQRIVFCKSAADAPLRKSCSECPFRRSPFPNPDCARMIPCEYGEFSVGASSSHPLLAPRVGRPLGTVHSTHSGPSRVDFHRIPVIPAAVPLPYEVR